MVEEFPEYFEAVEDKIAASSDKSVKGCLTVEQDQVRPGGSTYRVSHHYVDL